MEKARKPKKPKRDEVRKERISMEIVVDAHGEEERSMGWYCYLENTLSFPFLTRCINERAISPLRVGGLSPRSSVSDDRYRHSAEAPQFPLSSNQKATVSGLRNGRSKRARDGSVITMWKHLRAIVLLPGIVTLVIPGTILWRAGTDSFGLWQSIPASRIVLPMIGGFFICLGLLLMVVTIRLFVTVGRGTLVRGTPRRGS